MNEVNFLNSPYNGEMLPFERFKLYNWILNIKPKIVFEVGTGNGGGSTYYIAEAIKNLNNNGLIYTCDPFRGVSDSMLQKFKNIEYFQKSSNLMMQTLIEKSIKPNFIMFDGPENPQVAYDDIKFLENHIENGTYFSMHDWDFFRPYDNSNSTKSVKIRKYFENSKNWELVEQLHSNIKNSNFDNLRYDSVGLCLYKFIK